MEDLDKFLDLTEKLIEKESPHPTVIAISGSCNTGKSTLINNLLQQNICPVNTLPTNPFLIHINYGKNFSARAEGRKNTLHFSTPEKLSSFFTPAASRNFDIIEITTNNNLLKKFSLLDTPGIDISTPGQIELTLKYITRADKIIYLFHQRGIDKHNKDFIGKLTRAQKINHRDISFWVNCNLGKSDGTSLDNTRETLQNILGWTPEIYLINSFCPQSIDIIKKHMEINASKHLTSKINTDCREVDEKIPPRVQKALLAEDDAIFLSNFWDIKKDAEKILLTRNILNKLPLVENIMKSLIIQNQKKLLLYSDYNYINTPNSTTPTGIPEIKNAMMNLGLRIMHDSRIKNIIPSAQAGKWAGDLQKEDFKIAAVGGFSSGKSTFFNAVMGETILPAENRPTTGCTTYINFSGKRKAVINLNSKTTLRLCTFDNNKAEIAPRKIKALEEWLKNSTHYEPVLEIAINKGKGFQITSKDKLLKEITKTKKIFTSGLRSGLLDKRDPGELFRPVSSWKAQTKNAVQQVSLCFSGPKTLELDLEDPGEIKKFKQLTTSFQAYRIKDISLSHPAEFLKLATFIDTPGLDSADNTHTPEMEEFIKQSDAYLFFLNGKHVLNRHESGTLLDDFGNRLKKHLISSSEPQKEISKFFFIISFADTLTHAERQKVKKFVHDELFKYINKTTQLHLLSPLQALQGKDNKNFPGILEKIRKTVWDYRGKEYLLNHLNSLRKMIESPLNYEDTPPLNQNSYFTNNSYENKLSFKYTNKNNKCVSCTTEQFPVKKQLHREEKKILHLYLNEIYDIEKLIKVSGGFNNGKCQSS